MRNQCESYTAILHGSKEVLGRVLLDRNQQIKHAFALTPDGIFAAGEVFNPQVLDRLGIEPADYIRLESRAETVLH